MKEGMPFTSLAGTFTHRGSVRCSGVTVKLSEIFVAHVYTSSVGRQPAFETADAKKLPSLAVLFSSGSLLPLIQRAGVSVVPLVVSANALTACQPINATEVTKGKRILVRYIGGDVYGALYS